MKTERRHDLETNVLAARLTQWLERIKPYSGQLVGGVIVLLGLLVISSLWSASSADKQQAAWDAYALAQDTTDPELMSLRRLAEDEKYAGTPMQDWAHVTWADRQLLIAAQSYLINRSESLDRLRKISGTYETLASDAHDPQVRDCARFGLASVYELQDKPDEALQQYGMVQGDLQPMAEMRAQELNSPQVQEVSAWLATAELPKRSPNPGLGGPPNPPSDSADSPAADTRTLDEILGELGGVEPREDRYNADSSDEEAPSETSATEPSDGVPVADEATAEEAPADGTPAENPPADNNDAPATEEPAEDAEE